MIKRNVKRLVGAALVLTISIFAMVASASAKEPTGIFARYKQCPTNNPAVNVCFVGDAEGGEYQVGKIVVPIVKTQILQGGYFGEAPAMLTVIGAENGETLVKTPQVVPGGIFSLVKEGRYPGYLRNLCKNFPNNSECRVTATAELVGQMALSTVNLLSEEGIAVGLPLRLHLNNPLLGGRCFIGSATSPLQLNFTTGTTSPPPPNAPIQGKAGGLTIEDEFANVILSNDLLVDNSFSAPGAEGCGGPQSIVVDREIDQKASLPSPAGYNTTKLASTLFVGETRAVKSSEA